MQYKERNTGHFELMISVAQAQGKKSYMDKKAIWLKRAVETILVGFQKHKIWISAWWNVILYRKEEKTNKRTNNNNNIMSSNKTTQQGNAKIKAAKKKFRHNLQRWDRWESMKMLIHFAKTIK